MAALTSPTRALSGWRRVVGSGDAEGNLRPGSTVVRCGLGRSDEGGATGDLAPVGEGVFHDGAVGRAGHRVVAWSEVRRDPAEGAQEMLG